MQESESVGVARRLSKYIRNGLLNPRLLKFGVVGAAGVGVNMGSLYVLAEFLRIPYFAGSPVAIELSILSNFWMNLAWTWKDRSNSGTLWRKIWRYHLGAGMTAVVGNYLILIALTEFLGVNYLISNLVGIGVGSLSNYVINDLWTFKASR